MTYQYVYYTQEPKEVIQTLTPPKGGYKITRMYIKDGKLQIEYDNKEEEGGD